MADTLLVELPAAVGAKAAGVQVVGDQVLVNGAAVDMVAKVITGLQVSNPLAMIRCYKTKVSHIKWA
jgi:hypothetical protein